MDDRVRRIEDSAKAGAGPQARHDAGSGELQNPDNRGQAGRSAVGGDLGTGVPDDCQIDTGSRYVQLRDIMFRDIQAAALHHTSMKPVSIRVRIMPSHGYGIVYEIRMEWESLAGRRRRHVYALPDTVFRTERGPVQASRLVRGDAMLPDYATVSSVRPLYVQADFCSLVSSSKAYVDVGGMYVLTTER